MKKIFKLFFIGSVIGGFLLIMLNSKANPDVYLVYHSDDFNPKIPHTDDTIPGDTTLKYPFKDNSGNPTIKQYNSPLYLNNPSNIRSSVEYDPRTGKFIFLDKIGDMNYRKPYSMNRNEYQRWQENRVNTENWKERSSLETSKNADAGLVDRYINKNLVVPIKGFDRIFGTNTVSIKPQGSAELIFGINISKQKNPSLPKDLQKTVSFDFDEKINIGVTGLIGDKMKVGIKYDTEATFDFENQTTVTYQGKEDEIIQKIEAGNITLPLTGTLITGSHSLFGIKTELKFGKLSVTSVLSQQKGESQTIEIKGGATATPFEIQADRYEENKHYFLAHYFRDTYDDALKNLPVIRSGTNITRIEVWITNRSGNFNNSRNIVAFQDMGETNGHVYSSQFPASGNFPDNQSNTQYAEMTGQYVGIRDINSISAIMSTIPNFAPGRDYEKIQNARMLSASEYLVNENLGYISLNQSLNGDEVLAVAYEYVMGGKTYQVGEFSTDTEDATKTLILKLLKATTLSTEIPLWNLMMKNVYSIGTYQVNSQDFDFKILYRDDTQGQSLEFINSGKIANINLLTVMGLDNLNRNNEPGADGFFDFIDRITINSTNGRVYFPVVEPFGSHLRNKITAGNTSDPELNRIADQYVYEELYTQTQSQARQVAEKNKFFFKGEYRSSGGSEINLNAMNVPEGSVTVTAGGQALIENQDYTVDYNLGRVSIINQGLLESGTPISISLENNSLFNVGTKSLIGTHLNYQFSDKFNLGGTLLHLNEKPLTSKVSIGNEPISNTIWGLDLKYNTNAPFLTKFVDNIPFIETKEKSSLDITAEYAQLIPGHPKVIGEGGYSYIDDFEGTKTTIDLKSPYSWSLASTPQGQPTLFPEADTINSILNSYNRAKIAWYNINTDFLRNSGATPGYITADDQSDHMVREVYEKEIFPNRDPQTAVPTVLSILNLAYYPDEKGSYNYDVDATAYSKGISPDGKLLEPATRWGGITRSLITNDFEEANIEYFEFWVMDPFINEPTRLSGGDLYFDLGNVSEDILRDSRQSFENGFPRTSEIKDVDTTTWGRVPLLPRITDGFDLVPADARTYQDIGLDGLRGTDENSFYEQRYQYLSRIGTSFPGSQAYQMAEQDPSGDNFIFFRDGYYDQLQSSILERYKAYNNTEGNSAIAGAGQTTSSAATLEPDMEDINRDYTLNEIESYFQYRVHVVPTQMQIGQNFISDIRTANVTLKNEKTAEVKWYQFKIPITSFSDKIGTIEDFKSIRFVRMFMKGWDKPVVMRFAKLDLVRGEWRKYAYSMLEGSEGTTIPQTTDAQFDISAVNIEENAEREPVHYLLPPGITREISPSNTLIQELNEQAISFKILNLDDGDARAAYKNVGMDVRQFKKLQMFIHAEKIEGTTLNDNDLCVFIRMGSDYKENYYEYEVPLKLTPLNQNYDNNSDADRERVWPTDNFMDIVFEDLQLVKQHRNRAIRDGSSGLQLTSEYSEYTEDGRRISVMGTPNMSNVRTIMIGVRNRNKNNNNIADDGFAKSAEIWLNELRLSDFNEDGGWATQGRIALNLADFSTIAIAGNYSTAGFGSIEKKVSERQQSTDYGYDISTNFELGKFFPKKFGVVIPMYLGFSRAYSDPLYDPTDPDILLKTTLSDPSISKIEKDSIRHIAQDFIQRKSLNFTNVKINGNNEKKSKGENPEQDNKRFGKENSERDQRGQGGGKGGGNTRPFWHISNWTAGYGYNETFFRNPVTDHNILRQQTAVLTYTYNLSPKNIMPFRNIKIFRNKAFALINDFNFYLSPNLISVRNEMFKKYNEVQMRNLERPEYPQDTTYDKQFNWNRVYDVKYNLSRGIKLDYNATNASWINESRQGDIDKDSRNWQQNRDTVWESIKDFGRTSHFEQNISLAWNVPINKLPGFDWTNANAKYSAGYIWNVGPKTADTSIHLGNEINNSQDIQLSTQFNLEKLYTKVKYLKSVDDRVGRTDKKAKKKFKDVEFTKNNVRLTAGKAKAISHNLKTEDVTVVATDESGKPVEGETEVVGLNKIKFTAKTDAKGVNITVKGKKEVHENILSLVADRTVFALMSVRNISATYSETNATNLPGYLPFTHLFGMNSQWDAPGWGFLLGEQKDNFGQIAGDNGWITSDSLANSPLIQTHNISLNLRATLEPLNGFKIDLTADRTVNTQKDEFWVYTDNGFEGQNKRYNGSFSMSYNTLRTAFWKTGNIDYSNKAFQNFLDNRIIIAQRYADSRAEIGEFNYDPNTQNQDTSLHRGDFPYGYNNVSQDVLIPAFLAAYSDKSASKINTNAFPKIPFPNWRVQYDGLSKIPLIKQYFKKVMLTHGYSSKYTVGNYLSEPEFDMGQYDKYGFSNVLDSAKETYLPRYQIGSVAIDEKFVPVFGIELTWKNDLSTKFEFKQSRTLQLTLSNNWLLEGQSKEYTFGVGYKIPNLELNLNVGGEAKQYKSDLNIRADVTYGDAMAIVRRITEADSQISSGTKNLTIKVSTDYALNKTFTIRLFYDRGVITPRINGYQTSNTKIGFSIRFNLIPQ